jgi:uncharacterized protein
MAIRGEDMNCPACKSKLDQITVDGMTIELCQSGCGGMFFDQHELKKVDEPTELTGEKLVDLQSKAAVAAVATAEANPRRLCPKCPSLTMMRHYFSVKKEVVIDECASCGGMWLDKGELEKIRNEFRSADEKQAAEHHFFSTLFDPQLERARHEKPEESFSKMGRLFSFLRKKPK